MNYLRVCVVGLCMAFSLMAWAEVAPAMPVGDVEHGKALSVSATCVTCHGADGKALMPIYPNLAGQNANYIYQSLQAFKQGATGPRANATVMPAMVAALSDQDMADLAAYYAAQPAVHTQADPTLLARGERIYRGGLGDAKVPACAACHGPKGEGNALAGFPALAGQTPDYIVSQLQAFREGQRQGGMNDMMHGVATGMTTDDMKAVASYISGLH